MDLTEISNKPALVELGDRIKKHRLNLNISQEELSKQAGISRGVLQTMEIGNNYLIGNLVKVIAKLNIATSLDTLVPEPNVTIKQRASKPCLTKKEREPCPEEFNAELKEYIRNRDGYICQYCGVDEIGYLITFDRVLDIHHIDYNKENLEYNNLITLCNSCNVRVNINRDYWKKYFNDFLNEMYYGT